MMKSVSLMCSSGLPQYHAVPFTPQTVRTMPVASTATAAMP